MEGMDVRGVAMEEGMEDAPLDSMVGYEVFLLLVLKG
jgi:hypothetical protein